MAACFSYIIRGSDDMFGKDNRMNQLSNKVDMLNEQFNDLRTSINRSNLNNAIRDRRNSHIVIQKANGDLDETLDRQQDEIDKMNDLMSDTAHKVNYIYWMVQGSD